jgi:hypothetical protein
MSLELPAEVSMKRSNAAIGGEEHVDGERHRLGAVEECRGRSAVPAALRASNRGVDVSVERCGRELVRRLHGEELLRRGDRSDLSVEAVMVDDHVRECVGIPGRLRARRSVFAKCLKRHRGQVDRVVDDGLQFIPGRLAAAPTLVWI